MVLCITTKPNHPTAGTLTETVNKLFARADRDLDNVPPLGILDYMKRPPKGAH